MPARKSSSSKKASSSTKAGGAKKTASRKTAGSRKSSSANKTSKRTLIEPQKGDRRYVRRNKEGEFTTKQVDVDRSLAADRRRKSKTKVPKDQGDRGETGKKKGILEKIFG